MTEKSARFPSNLCTYFKTEPDHMVDDYLHVNLEYVLGDMRTALDNMTESERVSIDLKWLEGKHRTLGQCRVSQGTGHCGDTGEVLGEVLRPLLEQLKQG